MENYIEDPLRLIIFADFIIELSDIQPLDDRIVIKFISLAKNPVSYTDIYSPTLFRWDFGDATPIVESNQRVVYHIYEHHPKKYLIKHQACNFCSCSDWNMCYKMITIRDDKEIEEKNCPNH